MSYLCAGLYAEGPTDYAFLLALLDQLVPRLAHAVLPTVPMIGESVGIDAPRRTARREERIAAAIDAAWEQCTLFIVHADGGGDPDRASREQVRPGIELARKSHADLAAAACVPVREIEAWLLTDPTPFLKLTGAGAAPQLPRDAEAVLDPKQELRRTLEAIGVSRLRQDVYAFFGANVDIAALQRLPAFARFEEDLAEAIRIAARTA